MTSLSTLDILLRVALVVVCLGLVIWIWRCLGMSVFFWASLALAPTIVAWSLMTIPPRRAVADAVRRLQEDLGWSREMAFFTMVPGPTTLSYLSMVMLLLVGLAEFELRDGYRGSSGKEFVYRWRYVLGALAVLFAAFKPVVMLYGNRVV
jgi:hypothetical protein